MTRKEKRAFVRTFSRSIRDSILRAVPAMPEAWDGHELRQLFADLHAREIYRDTMRGRRKREYENERAVNYKLP